MRDLLPGVLAWSGSDPSVPVELPPGASVRMSGAVRFSSWGLDVSGPVAVLSRVCRRSTGTVTTAEIDTLIRREPAALTALLPPFGAMLAESDRAILVGDGMGFRQLFHSEAGSAGPGVLSSSALLAAAVHDAPFDETAVAVQSLLGWQLGQRTMWEGVHKLAPGATAELTQAGVRSHTDATDRRPRIALAPAVADAAQLLRRSLEALLDDAPEAVLQLTGGLDSRLLLSAIPPGRRRGLRAMTLGVPGSGDVAIAAEISRRYGMQHEVHGLADLGDLDPAQAWELCRDAAVRLDCMSDPVALAALGVAERAFDQGVRISGLGGEVARGFYYVGRVRRRAYSRKDAANLAAWRMFVNEAVEPGLLTSDFSAWAREAATDQVHAALRAGGQEWFEATDELYLRHRMQRWAGATDTAVAYQRVVVNPMLDEGFLDICSRLAPADKAGSRFLAALQMELDPELGRRPLDGRPSPSSYAHPKPWQPSLQLLRTGKRTVLKAAQRLRSSNRPPAGGEVMAGKVVAHWRDHPELLGPLSELPFLSPQWLAGVVDGGIEPRPSAVGFLTNLVVAAPRR